MSWQAEDRTACCRLGLILPISKDHMVWTCAAPAKLLEAAGVKFDPSNGGAFRASTQAVSDSPENALDVSPAWLGSPCAQALVVFKRADLTLDSGVHL